MILSCPDHPQANIGLARVLAAQERSEESRALITSLEKRGYLEPEAEKVKAALDLLEMGAGDLATAQAALAVEPDNRKLQLDVAEAMAGQRKFEEALQLLLKLVEHDKLGVGEKARQIMIDIFRVLPEDSPLPQTYRRKLASLLY